MLLSQNESDDLAKKKLVCCCKDDHGISFRVPLDIRESLSKFGEYKPESRENLSTVNKLRILVHRFH
jgi:hypothetical protein